MTPVNPAKSQRTTRDIPVDIRGSLSDVYLKLQTDELRSKQHLKVRIYARLTEERT
jgi:hypothetical protein